MSSASASSAIVRSLPPSASRRARWTGARRGGSASPTTGRSTRTRRGLTSAARNAQCERMAPERRSRSSQAVRPRRGAERIRLASATRPSASAASARPAGRSVRVADLPPAVEPRLEARRQHRRQCRADRRAIVGGDLLGQDEQVGRQHRGRDDCLDRLELAGLRPVLSVGLAIEHVAERQPSAVRERAGASRERAPAARKERVAEGALRTVGECVDGHAHRATGQGHSGAAFRSVGDAVARGVPLPG